MSEAGLKVGSRQRRVKRARAAAAEQAGAAASAAARLSQPQVTRIELSRGEVRILFFLACHAAFLKALSHLR